MKNERRTKERKKKKKKRKKKKKNLRLEHLRVHVIYPSWSSGPSSSAQFLYSFTWSSTFYPLRHIITTTHSRVCCPWCSWARTAGLGQLRNLPSSINPSICLDKSLRSSLLSFRQSISDMYRWDFIRKKKDLDPFLPFICRFQLNNRDGKWPCYDFSFDPTRSPLF